MMRTALALVLVWSVSSSAEECESCPALHGRSVCRLLADLVDQVELVAAEVERRTSQIGRLADLEERVALHEAHFERRLLTSPASSGGGGTTEGEGGSKGAHQEIRQLKERLDVQEARYEELLKAVEEIEKNEILPFPQPLVSNIEDNMLGDSDDGLSLLLAKVEKVENITSEVQEELKSERRVRRHLEEDLNATRHDVRMLNDKLEMAAHDIVEELANRTLFEDRINDTRESYYDEDKVRSLRFEEEHEYIRAILTDLRENSTEAMTLGTARVNDLEARVAELANASEGMDTTIRKDIQNIQAQLDALAQVQLDERLTRSEIRNLTFEVLASLDQRVALISEDLANAEHKVDSLETSTKHRLKDIDTKLRNATNFWNAALSAMAEHLTKEERLEEALEDAPSYGECGAPPPSPDPHLLIFPDQGGRLGFACRPPGAFVRGPANVTCVRSEWAGRMPECRRLPAEEDIQAMELPPSDPCANSFGPVPDTSDCASYFECGEGSTARRCPEGLLFDPGSRSCEPAHSVRCQTADPLADLVPPILVEGVDAPYSGLGTGTRGELVVHPRTSLVLHCLYPDGAQTPSWRKIQEQDDDGEEVFEDVFSVPLGPNRHSIRIQGAHGGDSGVYECVTPRGRANRVTLVVKSVVCPPLPPPAFHRPHPEGEERVLSTLAEVRCRDGSTATALCTAAGTWDADCDTPTKGDAYPWGCPPLPAPGPALLFEPQGGGRAVLFRCGPGAWLVGPAFTRCQEDGRWTHARLPECHRTAL